MQVYIYDGMHTQGLEDYIESEPELRTLVMELFYRYGLTAYDMKPIPLTETTSEILLTMDGLYYGSAWVAKQTMYDGDTGAVKTAYTNCFMSKTFQKGRGSDNRDRHTLRSKHLSTLMKNIDKNEAIPAGVTDLTDSYAQVKRMIAYIENAKKEQAGAKDKKRLGDIGIDDIHMMMSYVASERKLEDIPKDIISRCKTTLDIWNEMDKNANSYMDYMKSMFETPVYVVQKTKAKGYVIGKLQVKPESNDIEEVNPWRRVMTIEDYEEDELNALFTMGKVYFESVNDHRWRKEDCMLYTDAFIEDINMATYYESTDSYYGGAWLLIPTTIPNKDLGKTS